jgi:hypothetical protein
MNLVRTARLVLAGLLPLVGAIAQELPAWQVVLLKPPGCGACGLVEEILKRQGSIREVTLSRPGESVVAAIERRTSQQLTPDELAQLRALPGFDELRWRRQASVPDAMILLKHEGRVVAGGDIADSAELRDAELPLAITTPDLRTPVEQVRELRGAFYRDFFNRQWNLDHFFRMARDPAYVEQRSVERWVQRQAAAATKDGTGTAKPAANVLLMATAYGSDDNEIFNALRITEIRERLAGIGVDDSQVRVFYGAGAVDGANAVEERNRRLAFTRRDLPGAEPFRPQRLAGAFAAFRERPGTGNLLVLVGHGAPEGAGMWGHPAGLTPDDLHALHRFGGGDDVLVSGNCFGGVMARATSCGFFGARPDVVATGCQAHAAQVAQSADYLHAFFGSLDRGTVASADADRDGHVSFEEAHWQATLYGDERNVTYTTLDALAEEWFERHPDGLPASLTVGEIQDLARRGSAAEQRAVRSLTLALTRDQVVKVGDFAEAAARYSMRPEGPRPVLGQLAKRLLFVAQRDGDGELAAVRRCGERAIPGFLRRPSP